MNDRVERLERRVGWLIVVVAVLAASVTGLLVVVLWFSFPEQTLAALQVTGFLIVAGLLTLAMTHRQLPAVAREVGRWFAPLR
ncbi:hypothetical protein Pan44_29430 [Caulifigura coniformis]|uniref:Uncharacterized protein n=1 Tax=Caulifigura coniformis TaxID=2527983 RepID=A0A517SFJ6_9PLAN|nr:hypothetical protein [Caulifigura coniformis]QDT54904.1 hypothetical protein Pan44_29430 [Caulifigura coniformis]